MPASTRPGRTPRDYAWHCEASCALSQAVRAVLEMLWALSQLCQNDWNTDHFSISPHHTARRKGEVCEGTRGSRPSSLTTRAICKPTLGKQMTFRPLIKSKRIVAHVRGRSGVVMRKNTSLRNHMRSQLRSRAAQIAQEVEAG